MRVIIDKIPMQLIGLAPAVEEMFMIVADPADAEAAKAHIRTLLSRVGYAAEEIPDKSGEPDALT